MLLTKSFDISDDKGVNELLSKYRLASGAHILVSEGKILVPYEDGAPPNNAQRIVQIAEDRNKVDAELHIIEHSQKVLDHLIADAEDRVNVARAQVEKETANQPRKVAEEKLKTAEKALEEVHNQKRMNDHEIIRLKLNIELFEAEMKRLGAE